ncbi:pseudouridine synthase [Spelaeicoccus albus]|uniref:RNA pseudouridylate synthase n=1 Tax=Spelaeicoccus albus TaxID=1280376 RepID=A0A7Z0AC85_9MICO|nr:pseudouridine synthase [Spelaeicoccus albus]NYI67380.1 tRNA pseudouridine32 synthase/23S rRNA pseudouridine746 synthase [Spelaeicoccus albus]
MTRPPLPVRDGLNPSRITMPDGGHWHTVADYLTHRFGVADVRRKIDAGEIVDAGGGPVTHSTTYSSGAVVYLYRDPPDEAEVPFAIELIHRDETLVVADKPHFLASTPRGAHVVQTALVRLRRTLGNPDLSPAHRLDRLTAGVLLFTARPDARAAYQLLFERREVSKTYEAIAPVNTDLTFPFVHRSRLVKQDGILAAFEVPGAPNAETEIELVESAGGLGRFLLRPRTGKTHQLRAHMNALGMPIIGDDFYPEMAPRAIDDYSQPLQLLARTLEFDDPFTGRARRFDSRRRLVAWPG